MKLTFHYIRIYWAGIVLVMALKLTSAFSELMLPYILEHLIDNVVPQGSIGAICLWGAAMILCAVATWQLNLHANQMSVDNAHKVAYDLRRDLFHKTIYLSGTQFDTFGLPSLTSRMTSDSYNVQNFVRTLQTLCVRAPIILLGGIVVTLTMDLALSCILCCLVPILLAVVIGISRKGIPLYNEVQQRLDDVVRAMRENITGIRVVKALSKTEYEKRRFLGYNQAMTRSDMRTSALMAFPGPFMQLCLNVGLTLVVYVGAVRVNSGVMKPGVILAFLTYFNMILQSIMAINRMFMMVSKATASADRIGQVLDAPEDLLVLPEAEAPGDDSAYISFSHVNFSYHTHQGPQEDFSGGAPELCLKDISFQLNRGQSLGIIGPTGCGKTTIVNLLMRFYDPDSGSICIDGRDVRTYPKEELRRKFGVVFQNDVVFQDTLNHNIAFGREVTQAQLRSAIVDAMAAEFIDRLDDGLEHMAQIKGANLSGGQKQRIFISRALAGNPDILILDDASSALDYKTDSLLRKAILEHYQDSATILIAQRVSSVMSMTNILVMDNGACIGYGNHETLLKTCPAYRAIYETQMGSLC